MHICIYTHSYIFAGKQQRGLVNRSKKPTCTRVKDGTDPNSINSGREQSGKQQREKRAQKAAHRTASHPGKA